MPKKNLYADIDKTVVVTERAPRDIPDPDGQFRLFPIINAGIPKGAVLGLECREGGIYPPPVLNRL